MKSLTLLCGCSLVACLMAGCNRGAQDDGVTIGYAAPSLADEGQVAIQRGAQTAADGQGWNFTTTDAGRDAARQIEQIDTLLARGVSAIVMVPVDSAALTVAVEKANKQGVPIIAIDRTTTGGDLLVTVQSDNYLAGQQAAERMVELLTEKYGEPRGLVLELQGTLGTNVAQERGGGFNDVMAEYENITVLSKPTDWDPDTGGQTVATALAGEHADIDGIYWHSDAIGLGVVPALERLQRMQPVGEEGHIFLVGIDGMPGMLEYIREGKVDATMSQNLLDLGQVALELLSDHLAETPVPTSGEITRDGAPWSPATIETVETGPLVNLATTPIDKTNVDDPGHWGNAGREGESP